MYKEWGENILIYANQQGPLEVEYTKLSEGIPLIRYKPPQAKEACIVVLLL